MKRYRKIVTVLIACALMLAVLNPTVATATVDYNRIKVKLTSMGTPSSVQFKVAGAFRIVEKPDIDLYRNITYTIKTDGSGQKLTYHNGVSTVSVSLPATVTFKQYYNGSSSNFLYVNNPGYGWRNYSGDMTFRHPSGTSYLQLINTVYIETYLYGVVAYEMSNDWPIEALKAQAVAARTYAARYIKANEHGTYHIGDTSANQVYKGYPLTSSGAPMQRVIDAVNATCGSVIVTGNPALMSLVDGMYSASNGGQIRTAHMKYGSTDTYHVFKNDDYDRNNSGSPAFRYIFPVTNDAATLALLSANDRSKVDTMLALIKGKLPAALLAQHGFSCGTDNIAINGITAAVPIDVRPGMPEGCREYTKVRVTVDVTANGSSIPMPVAEVLGKGEVIPRGDATPRAEDDTDFGAVGTSGGTKLNSFVINNTGNNTLNISSITITGTDAADFTVGTPIPTSISAGSNSLFTIEFHPTTAGEKNATVQIASDEMHTPYTFAIKGTGVAPSSEKSITSFGFIDPDVDGNIADTNVSVLVPSETNVTALIAEFETTGVSVKVGDTEQVSGVTANDFTNPVQYTVTAEDGTQRVYTVTVTLDAPSGGGGMPLYGDILNFTVTVDLVYISQSSGGQWDVRGELRTAFSNFSSLLNTTNLWNLYEGASSDGKFLYVTARGYGHGIGLSQRGAQQMANSPNLKTCAEIIDFYYNISAGLSHVVSLSTAQSPLSQIPGKSPPKWGKVVSNELNVRATRSTSGTKVGLLHKNDIVEILDTSSSWHRILQASTGLVGYVSASTRYIRETPETPPPPTGPITPGPSATPTPTGASPTPTATPTPLMGRIAATTLTLRSQPSTSSTAIMMLEQNDAVLILDPFVATNWFKVQYGPYVGYCMSASTTSNYVEIIGPQPTPPAGGTPIPTGPVTLTPVTAMCAVDSGSMNIRSSASTSASKKGSIPKSATFTVLTVAEADSAWLYIQYGSVTGYVMKKYSTVFNGSSYNSNYQAVTVKSTSVNIRSEPSLSSDKIITQLHEDDTLASYYPATVTGDGHTWYKVYYGPYTGYIDINYARISKNN